MDPHEGAIQFGVAIGLGVLIGLERQRALGNEDGAGVRTFALIALAGAVAGYLDANLGLGTLALALFAAIAALVVAVHVLTFLRGDAGLATEVSALLCFVLGLLCTRGQPQLAAALAVVMALLLTLLVM